MEYQDEVSDMTHSSQQKSKQLHKTLSEVNPGLGAYEKRQAKAKDVCVLIMM